ncbi:LysM peptidoglycan-binding domain-containing protein [Roseibium sp.]|uniref:LysM peptidoglycan-binding domain-containing protein n=2 Tax=Roseibium sp. TaxID=1936156 RepID=UPI00326594CA
MVMASPPHLPPLAADYEKKPASVHYFYNEYAPVDMSRYAFYRVVNGDTLENIAVRVGTSAKNLLKECFGTTDPREVNWYLRNKIGCKELGPQGKNFAFSIAADPGKICLPLKWAARLEKKIRYPDPRIYRIFPELPNYKQDNDNGCWAAALANVYDWGKSSPGRKVEDALEEIDPEFAQRYRDEKFITGPDAKTLFEKARLANLNINKYTINEDTAFAVDDSTILEFLDFVERNAPFIMLQSAKGLWTHWIVINGFEWTSAYELWLRYFDPGDKTVYFARAEKILRKCYNAPTLFPKAYG